METAIVVTVYLQGQLSGCVAHKSKQTYSVNVGNGKTSLVITKEIEHTDRAEVECCRRTNVSLDAVKSWLGDCPEWAQPKKWKTLSQKQRIAAFVQRFDEGYGVDFEIVSLS